MDSVLDEPPSTLSLAESFIVTKPSPEEAARVLEQYQSLYSAIDTRTGPEQPLLLAHYTSVQVVEQILRNDEIWFANPLYMNDLEEMRVGVLLGTELFPEFVKEAGSTDARAQILAQTYNHYFERLSNESALDTYVFCLCEHKADDTDGKLSMWREYGSKGNGAALVFNTQRISYQPHSPLVIAKVAYKSKNDRRDALKQALKDWATITLAANLPDDRLYLAAHSALSLVTSLALTTKHKGFEEEGEWRVVYLAERDHLNYMKSCKSYFVGPRGVEPKLKLKFGKDYLAEPATAGAAISTGQLSNVLEFILLGPTVSSPLAKASFIRMLEGTNKSAFRDKVFTSGIPLRASP